MRRKVSILLSIFLSTLIVYGGSGVNTFFDCCGECHITEPTEVAEDACCETHTPIQNPIHNQSTRSLLHIEEHKCEQMISDLDGECVLDWIQFDWKSYQGSQQLHSSPNLLSNHLFYHNGYIVGFDGQFPLPSCKYRQSQKPPDLSKEDYFSLLTILII